MSVLGVVDVLVQDDAAWCQVQCLDGALRVGNTVNLLRRGDGSTLEVSLAVESIELATGQAMQLEQGATGRIRLRGTGVGEIQAGLELITAADYGYPAAPPMAAPSQMFIRTALPPIPEGERPALVVDEASHLSRVTTAFRYILVIPQLFVLYALGVAAEIVLIIGWFGALFMGRLPDWAGDFMSNVLRYQARVYTYLSLVTDKYPPFDFTGNPYPAQLRLPERGKLNRLSVFFRGLLVIPAALVASLVALGWYVAGFIIWLIVLIMGRFPHSLFGATVAMLRFNFRVTSYLYLLTSRYPRGLFGDQDEAAMAGGYPPPLAPDPATGGTTPYSEQPMGYSSAPAPAPVPGPATYPGSAPAEPQPATVPLSARTDSGALRLILSSGAKRLIVLFMVIGLLAFGAYGALIAYASTQASPREAQIQLTDAYNQLSSSVDDFRTASQACQAEPAADQLGCAQAADADLADSVDEFSSDVEAIDRPSGTSDEFDNLLEASNSFGSAIRELSQAGSLQEYTSAIGRLDLQQRGSAVDSAYNQLRSELISLY